VSWRQSLVVLGALVVVLLIAQSYVPIVDEPRIEVQRIMPEDLQRR